MGDRGGHKTHENRTAGSIRAGGMGLGRVAIHAASAMREKEYAWAVWRMAKDGVRVPQPADLPRRAIVGAVTVTGIVSESDSPWFGGPMALELADAEMCAPIAAKGELGYFHWGAGGALAPAAAWMRAWEGGSLFGDLPPALGTPPEKPWGPKR